MMLRSTLSALARGRLKYPISVAPMVDISTPYFLELLHIISGGDRYAYYTEMQYPRAILANASQLTAFIGPPRPNVVVQLGGSDPALMGEATKVLAQHGYHEVNVNVGCPSPAVQQGQFGAVLMKTPDVVASILDATASLPIPVTVKCRLGVDHLDSFEFLHSFVHRLSTSVRPPSHLIVHARKCLLRGLSPKKNRTVPPLDYPRVYRLAEAFPELAVTINGGFVDAEMVSNALDKVDGCMIGRQVMNSPLFLQTLDRGIYNIEQVKTIETIIKEYLDYADNLLSYKLYPKGGRIPPFTILSKPLQMLYSGKQGRVFRRVLSEQLKQTHVSFDRIVLAAMKEAMHA